MPQKTLVSIIMLGFAAVAFAVGLGACSGSSGNPTIAAPTTTMTPSPTPTLVITPSSITFPPGNRTPQQVNIIAPNPSDVSIAVVKDSCTPNHIAKEGPATPPPSPSPTPTPQTYTITPDVNNGTCAFTFQDNISLALGRLIVTNQSGAARLR
ncbi:MAG: hypothetical protein JO043_03220 [Candidatus Eremiobacteraeota bacterium]|nr:hypothetical protein [Candidatus Eremiobacteraeota bacterium]